MLEQKENLLDKNALLGIRRQKKEQSRYEKARHVTYVISTLLSLVIIGLVYFMSDVSNVYRITVRGNSYLSDEDIIELSGITTKDKYLFVLPFMAEKKVEAHELIGDCRIRRLDGRLVEIDVEEKKAIAYQENVNGIELILRDNERIVLEDRYRYLINYVPVIEGFDEEETKLIISNLQECDYLVINEISEIRNYPDLKYQNVELIMRDGNCIFTSPYGLDILDHYYNIQSSYISNRQVCYYFEDISGNAYSSACPWEAVEEEQMTEQEETGE